MHSVFGACPWALAGILRGQASRLCGAGPLGQPPQVGYGLLRQAQNLECMATLNHAQPRFAAVDLAGFAQGLGLALAEVCPHREQLPRLEIPAVCLPVWAPPLPLAVSVLNLVSNSLLYAGPQPELRLLCRQAGPWAVLAVRDGGPGLFSGPLELFGSGAGLGLALAQRTAHRCGGMLLLDSAPSGLTAALALPLRPQACPPTAPGPGHWLKDRFSPLFLQLADCCILPD